MLPENQNDVPNINLINSDIATSTKLLDPIYDMKPNIEGLDSPTGKEEDTTCLLYTSPSPRDGLLSRMPSSA